MSAARDRDQEHRDVANAIVGRMQSDQASGNGRYADNAVEAIVAALHKVEGTRPRRGPAPIDRRPQPTPAPPPKAKPAPLNVYVQRGCL